MEEKTMLTFPAFFAATLSRFGTRDALALAGERPLTYIETNDSILAVIAFLEKLGIRPGDNNNTLFLGTDVGNYLAHPAITSIKKYSYIRHFTLLISGCTWEDRILPLHL